MLKHTVDTIYDLHPATKYNNQYPHYIYYFKNYAQIIVFVLVIIPHIYLTFL